MSKATRTPFHTTKVVRNLLPFSAITFIGTRKNRKHGVIHGNSGETLVSILTHLPWQMDIKKQGFSPQKNILQLSLSPFVKPKKPFRAGRRRPDRLPDRRRLPPLARFFRLGRGQGGGGAPGAGGTHRQRAGGHAGGPGSRHPPHDVGVQVRCVLLLFLLSRECSSCWC